MPTIAVLLLCVVVLVITQRLVAHAKVKRVLKTQEKDSAELFEFLKAQDLKIKALLDNEDLSDPKVRAEINLAIVELENKDQHGHLAAVIKDHKVYINQQFAKYE